jgi:hypothetical protein
MSEFLPGSKAKADENLRLLKAAFGHVLQFASNRAGEVLGSDEQIRKYVDEEASFGRASVDEESLTAGMWLHVVQPLRSLIAEWDHVRGAFTTAIQPFMDDLRAVEKLDAEISDLRTRRGRVTDTIERRAEADHGYSVIKQKYEQTQARYSELHNREGRRTANVSAYSLFYWLGLFCIGMAEWLINYDTFFFFLGVPAIAAGTTVIMGVLLAFAAHEHGTLLRQWSVTFGEHQSKGERFAHYRILIFATLALLLVVGTAGASRYEFARSILADQPSVNILGAEARIESNPLKDVSLSLLGNVGAWAVGVFLSYMCHDRNPDYMEATYDARKAERAFVKARQPFAEEIKREEARIEREINDTERSAIARSADVSEQRSMLMQVIAHEESVLGAMVSTLRRGIEGYRSALIQIAITQRGTLRLIKGTVELTPYEYQAMKLSVDRDMLHRLVGLGG